MPEGYCVVFSNSKRSGLPQLLPAKFPDSCYDIPCQDYFLLWREDKEAEAFALTSAQTVTSFVRLILIVRLVEAWHRHGQWGSAFIPVSASAGLQLQPEWRGGQHPRC